MSRGRLHILRLMKSAMPVIVAGLLAGLPAVAHAQARQCTIQSAAASIGFNAFNIPRDAAIGTALSEVVTTTATVSCPANPVNSYGGGSAHGRGPGFYLQIFPYLRVATGMSDVWATGTQGVGIRVITVDYGNRTVSWAPYGGKTDFGPIVAQRAAFSGTFRFTYQLIKTGQIVGTGQISTGNMFVLRSHSIPENETSAAQAPVSIRNSAFNALTCRVTTPSVSVTLRNVNVTELRTTGAAAGRTNFSIGLECDAGSNVYVTLTDATRPANRTSVLALGRTSTASGVGVRIRNPDDEVVSFGADSPVAGNTNQWLVGSSDTTTNIPLSAEYVATGTVQPGTVQALATFTMSYQ